MKQLNFRPDEELLAQLELRDDPARGGMAAAAKRSLSRYFDLIDREREKLTGVFTPAEISLVVDICNGTLFEPFIPGAVAADVEDAEDAYEKWHVSRSAILEKLRALTPLQEAALIDAIERFWIGVTKKRSLDVPDPASALK